MFPPSCGEPHRPAWANQACPVTPRSATRAAAGAGPRVHYPGSVPARRSLISLLDLTREDLERIWLAAAGWRAAGVRRRGRRRDARVATIMPPRGYRTKLAFDAAIDAIGAHRVDVPVELGAAEPVEDTAAILSGAVDAVVVRTPDHDVVTRLAEACEVPVVNAMTDRGHPCEVISEAFTLLERGRLLDGLRVVAVGAGTNVVRSWCELAAHVELDLIQVCPPGHEADAGLLEQVRAHGMRGSVTVSHDLAEAAAGADVLYLDSWPAAARVEGRRRTAFLRQQVTPEVLDLAGRDVVLMHVLPAHRGEEISAEAFADPRNISFASKRNLAATSAAIIEHVLGSRR